MTAVRALGNPPSPPFFKRGTERIRLVFNGRDRTDTTGSLAQGAVFGGAPVQGMIGTAVIEFFGEPSISLSL